MNQKSDNMSVIIKPKTRQQLAKDYGVNIKTLNKWLKNENIILEKGLICPRKVEEIYRKLGKPESVI